MDRKDGFALKEFMPYLLNQAADVASLGFESYYKSKYGMLRTEWRVIFHIGRYHKMTAKDVCERARIHKTKVSRAVQALETKGYLKRTQLANDRRLEHLELTNSGRRVFQDLCAEAERYDAEMMAAFSKAEQEEMRKFLVRIAQF